MSGRLSQISAGGIGHVGDAVRLARHQPFERRGQVGVKRRLVRRFDLEVVHQSILTFPRPRLTALRPFFSIDPLGLGRPARPGRLALALDQMGLGDHFGKARRASSRLASCVR